MPFELNEYDRTFVEFLHTTVRELARASDPVLSQIEFVGQSTTASTRIRSRDGVDVDLPEHKVGFEFVTSLEDVRAGNYDAFTSEVDKAAQEMASELMAAFIGALGAITSATGNVVDAGGNLTFEKFYELLDKMEWSLTDEGELSIPSLMMNPANVKSLPPETPETRAAMEELKQRKYEEALARRRRRRLS